MLRRIRPRYSAQAVPDRSSKPDVTGKKPAAVPGGARDPSALRLQRRPDRSEADELLAGGAIEHRVVISSGRSGIDRLGLPADSPAMAVSAMLGSGLCRTNTMCGQGIRSGFARCPRRGGRGWQGF